MKLIPTEAQWENYWDDLDTNYAHRIFFGKSNEEMQEEFRRCVIERVDEIRWMPKIPFQYYIFGLRDYVMERNFGFYDSSDAASCFLGLISEKLKKQPHYVKPVFQELLPSLRFVSENQELYDADIDIYGSFIEKYNEIISLFEGIK